MFNSFVVTATKGIKISPPRPSCIKVPLGLRDLIASFIPDGDPEHSIATSNDPLPIWYCSSSL